MSNITKEEIKKLAELLRDNKQVKEEEPSLAKAIDKRMLKAQSEKRLQKAIAEHYPKTRLELTMKAVASTDPFALQVEMVLLPLDKANKNKQAIPSSEADNILTTALYKPIRAMYDGESVAGHALSTDVGTITSVYRADNNIKANGVIWLERNESFGAYLRTTAEHKGSFEIYYARSEVVNGIEYLYDTVFAAQAFVNTPAYGSDTPIKIHA